MVAIARTSNFRAGARGLAMLLSALVACALTLAGTPRPAAADQIRATQWQLGALDARDAWKLSTGAGVIVAVIDSGVDATHPDLVGQVLPGADFVSSSGSDGVSDGRIDPVGHGTTVAGLIAARADDKRGVEGIAPGAKILPIRVLDRENKYDDPSTVAAGVRWAVDHGAGVINLSLGGGQRSESIASALRYAAEHDVVVVACTGNIATDPSIHEVWYPAREPGVIAVAGLSSSATDSFWPGSLTGPETVLTAPAVNLTGAKPGGGYWEVQGTSFAAPLVAATASLIRARFPDLSAANVINRLIGTAKDLGPAGRDDLYGYGAVDPVAALRDRVAEVSTNPLAGASPRPAPTTAHSSAPAESAQPGRQGGGAPQPTQPQDASEPHPLATGEQVGSSATVGLLATLMILILGSAVVLALRRRAG